MSAEELQDIDESLYELHKIIVDPKQSFIRIDKFLMTKLERVTRNKIQKAIKNEEVKVNDKIIKSNYKVRPNDIISFLLPKPSTETSGVIAENIPLDIKYEDDDLLVVYKPPGMVVHPGFGNKTGTLVNALAHYFKEIELPVKEGNLSDRPGLVHRIDKDTSGVLVIAKTEEAMSHLGKQFYNHTVERKYQALVWGSPEETSDTIETYIGRDPSNRTRFMAFTEEEEGKHAITHYKVLEDLYYVSLIECQLETGRTHQIRVHLKHIGHPLFNDAKYNGDRIVKGTVFSKYKTFVENNFKILNRQALHAKSLGFIHPRTGEKMYFETDLPDDMMQCLERWKKYLSGRKSHEK